VVAILRASQVSLKVSFSQQRGEVVRASKAFIAAIFLFGSAAPALAQKAVGFGAPAKELTYTPIDTSKGIVAPIGYSTKPKTSFWSNLVPKFMRKGSGTSPLPQPGGFPTAPRQNALQPVAPMTPKN
jgi:hypothetical protein